MNSKDSQFKLRTSPDILLTPRQHPSTQSLNTFISKNNYKDNPYGTSPNLKFVDPLHSPHKQLLNPSKNTSNQKNPLFFKHSEYRIGQKSPRTARVSKLEQQNRLSFKKSFKSITRNNNSNNHNSAQNHNNQSLEKFSIHNNIHNITNQQKQQNKGRQKEREKEKEKEKESLQEELIISLKEIKRLREVIEGLVRDNKKLKRIAHEILDGRFQDPVNLSVLTSEQTPEDKEKQKARSVSNSQIYNLLNSSLLSNPSQLQSLKLQNTKLSQHLSKLKQQLQIKQITISHMQSLLTQQKLINKQLQQQSQKIKIQYIHSRNKTLELQQKLNKFQKNNLNLSHIRGDIMAESRDVLQHDIDLSDDYSIVEEKIINNYEEREKNKLESLLKDQELSHQCEMSRVCNDYENIIAGLIGGKEQEKEKEKERETDSDSIRTKESQSVMQSNIMGVSLKGGIEYEKVGQLLRLGSRRGE